MTARLPITVRLESFEGPLDLLLYLIQSHEMDVSKISISRITDQYLAYVRLMQELNFDTASEFLVMAATLLHWKSKAILPQEENAQAGVADEDVLLSQEDLIKQLLEHQRFKAAGADLAQLPLLGEDVFARPNRRIPAEKIWKEMNLSDLTLAYQDMLVKQRKRTTVLRKETVSLASKIIEFRDRLNVGQITALRELLSEMPSRPEIVATFLASLELSRLKKMRLHQNETYAPIYLELLESLKNFDAEAANSGFEYSAQNPAQAAQNSAETKYRQEDERNQDGGAFQDDRRAAMDLTGEVAFNPLAQLENELNDQAQAGIARSKADAAETTHSTTGS